MTTERERDRDREDLLTHCIVLKRRGGRSIIPIFTERDRERYRERDRDYMDRNFVLAQGGKKTFCFLKWNGMECFHLRSRGHA
jgi:hypothetical protein